MINYKFISENKRYTRDKENILCLKARQIFTKRIESRKNCFHKWPKQEFTTNLRTKSIYKRKRHNNMARIRKSLTFILLSCKTRNQFFQNSYYEQ